MSALGSAFPRLTTAPPTACDVPALIDAYRAVGFEICADGLIEPGFDKIVLCGDSSYYHHAAKQLETGKWSSKLGEDVDIEHDTPEMSRAACMEM